jgi:hypothetical protein
VDPSVARTLDELGAREAAGVKELLLR